MQILGKKNATSEERDELYNLNHGLRERAVEALRQATQLAPRNATYHRELGRALYSLADSRNLTRRGIKEEEIESTSATARRDRDEGFAELRRAVALDPADAAAHKALAKEIDFGEEKLAEYRAAIRLDPADANSRIEMGELLLSQKDITGAIAEFRAAVRIDPKNAKAHMQLGFAFEEELGQMDKAIEEYRKSVDLGPDALGPSPYYRVSVLSGALTKAGKRKEAVKVIHDYLKLEPEYEVVFRERLLELERE